MRQWILSSLLISSCAGILLPAHSRPAERTIFSDEFSGRELDRSKWNTIVTGETVNDEQQAYVDSPETIAIVHEAAGADGGALAIHTRYHRQFTTPEGRTFDFISGRLDTRSKFDFTYGTAAARVKLTAGAGLWPAFWALGNGNWPETGEMDILENVGLLSHSHLERGAEYHHAAESGHVHLTCSRCGSDDDLSMDEAESLERLITKHRGFRPDLTHFAISGICKSCQDTLAKR